MSGTKGRKLPTSADVSEHQKVERYTVAVCPAHTKDILGESDDCVVCENKELTVERGLLVDELQPYRDGEFYEEKDSLSRPNDDKHNV